MDLAYDISKIPVLSERYWDRPKPSRSTGDPTVEKIYTAVGFALSTWESFEQQLASLFLAVCSCSNNSGNPVRRAFGTVESSAMRRKMIEEAAAVHFGVHWDDQAIRRSFLALTAAAGHAAKRRDDIAHGIAQHIGLNQVDYGAFLFPPYYNTGRTNAFGPPNFEGPPDFWLADFRYTSDDINEFAMRFAALRDATWTHINLSFKKDDGSIPFVDAVTTPFAPMA